VRYGGLKSPHPGAVNIKDRTSIFLKGKDSNFRPNNAALDFFNLFDI
jgi:hypothetical protein